MVAKTGDSKDIRAVKADDGVELHYEVLGDGPPVVLLHGVLVGRFAFSRMREALSENYQMILPSSRGHDGTEMTFPADYGFATSEVRDLSAIMAAEGLDQVHLVGHSSGGATAFAFARDCPERVDRLVLIEPTLVNAAEVADRGAVMAARRTTSPLEPFPSLAGGLKPWTAPPTTAPAPPASPPKSAACPPRSEAQSIIRHAAGSDRYEPRRLGGPTRQVLCSDRRHGSWRRTWGARI